MAPVPDEDFDAFVRGRSVPLLRAAYAMTGDRHAAEDLVQEVMAKVYLRWATIHTSPDAYARKVLARAVTDRWRWRRRRPETSVPEIRDPVVADRSEALAMRAELVAVLRTLPRRQRTIVALRYLADLPEADVAVALGCSVGTVKSQLSRGLARLRTALAAASTAAPTAELDAAPKVRTPTRVARRADRGTGGKA